MDNLPMYTGILFALTTFLTVGIFCKAANNYKVVLFITGLWLALQAVVSLRGFYTITSDVPPRFALLIMPPLVFILLLFITSAGRGFLDSLELKTLTLLHIVRIPVELVLFTLFAHKAIPQLITFEGRNFDILSGITAPVIYYFGFVKKALSRKLLLAWNFICLALLLNVVTYAVLSAPFPFQQLAFDQPNVAILYFPFTWLPCCVVPLVLLAHLASIRKLIQNNKEINSLVSVKLKH